MRAHWRKQWGTASEQKRIVYAFLKKTFGVKALTVPCRVVSTRVGKRPVDFDNLVYSFKTIRDAVADFILPGYQPGHADDQRLGILFKYDQKVGVDYAVEIEIIPVNRG